MNAPAQIPASSHLGNPDLWGTFRISRHEENSFAREAPNTTLTYVTGTNMPPISRILLLIRRQISITQHLSYPKCTETPS